MIYDISGRIVRTLVVSAGRGGGTVSWDGRNAVGEDAASGVYFCRVRWAGVVSTSKMLLVR